MRSFVRWIALAWLVVASASALLSSVAYAQSPATPTTTPAADGKPHFVDVRVGYDRHYKLGCWTPVHVVVWSGLASGAAPANAVLQLETADGDDAPSVYTSAPLQLTSGKPTPATMYVRFGNSLPEMVLTLLVDGRRVLRETVNCQEDLRPGFQPALPADERLILCVGNSTAVDDVCGRNGVAGITAAKLNDAVDLPNRAYGYDGVDAVVLAADEVRRFASLTPDGPQLAALSEWLELGGQLTIVAGGDAGILFGSPAWRKLAPIQFGESVPLPRTTALEEYAGGNKPLPPAEEKIRVLRSKDDGDVAEVKEGDLPLIVRRAVGLGILTVSFVDLELPQLKNWAGRTALVARAMRLGPLQSESDRNKSLSQRSFGYIDLAGQLRGALDQYEGVAVISFFVLALMILVYIALIGPLDYLLVRNVFRRTEMTWFTFPAIVVATSAAAYFAAVWMKGDELRVSQVDIVDCDAATGRVRGTTFAGIFSPTSDTYALHIDEPKKLFAGPYTPGRSLTTWFGLSGDGSGGMHSRGGGSWFTSPYQVAPDLERLSDVPIQVWSSKMFLASWQGRNSISTATAPVVLREEADGSLTGMLKSPLAVPLKGALLCYGTKAYQIGEFDVGKPAEIAKLNVRDLATELHQAEVVAAAKTSMNPGVRTRPHDVSSQKVDEIVRKMMFFDAAGGRDHASLEHNYHGYLDLSELLKLKRAVLVGYVDTDPDDGAALDLTSGGAPVARRNDRHWVFVRIVIPIEKAASP